MMPGRFAVCLISGGMDSATAAYLARDQGYSIIALHVNYGQLTMEKERECSRTIARLLGAEEYMEVDVGYLVEIGGSSLTDRRMEVEEFDAAGEGLPNTYVPFRNANLLSIATSLAEARGAEAIFIGAQALDYSGYPDCRPEFMEAFQRAIDLGTSGRTRIRLCAPFLHMTKTDILGLGLSLGVPYEHTWSCYRSGEIACGKCGSCHFRQRAFREAGVRDPLPYRVEADD